MTELSCNNHFDVRNFGLLASAHYIIFSFRNITIKTLPLLHGRVVKVKNGSCPYGWTNFNKIFLL